MMGKTRVIELTTEQRAALENGYRKGTSHTFRVRCQMLLLKSEQRSSLEVSEILGCCEMVINRWLNRYEAEGSKGLATRKGRGRKPKLSTQNLLHLKTMKAEIAWHPQSVKTVIAKLEEDLDMQMHPDTLKHFLKKIGYRILRARTSLKSRQVAEGRVEKVRLLNQVWQLSLDGRMDLYLGDESTFSMIPVLPYGRSPVRRKS